MKKQLEFIYQPSNKDIDEEKVKEAKQKIADFLVKKALEKMKLKE